MVQFPCVKLNDLKMAKLHLQAIVNNYRLIEDRSQTSYCKLCYKCIEISVNFTLILLCLGVFSYTNKYNKNRVVHYILRGVTDTCVKLFK